jgi:hypothetical protein
MARRVRRIKVNRIDFDEAINYGFVYGWDLDKRVGNSAYSVYVDLGEEKLYQFNPKDSISTNYRLFINCTAKYAENDAKADEGDFAFDVESVSVKLYY